MTAAPRVFLDGNVLISALIGDAGSPPVTREVPAWLALALARGFDAARRLTGNPREPRLARFVVHEMSN